MKFRRSYKKEKCIDYCTWRLTKQVTPAHLPVISSLNFLQDSQCIIFVNRKSDRQTGNEGSSTEADNHLVPPTLTTGRFERDTTGESLVVKGESLVVKGESLVVQGCIEIHIGSKTFS